MPAWSVKPDVLRHGIAGAQGFMVLQPTTMGKNENPPPPFRPLPPPLSSSPPPPPSSLAFHPFPPSKVDAIDASTEAGRERLKKIVATLLNSYLAQLLESGFLHADPHPGNFLCTPDGKLCVLDMGLMTEASVLSLVCLVCY